MAEQQSAAQRLEAEERKRRDAEAQAQLFRGRLEARTQDLEEARAKLARAIDERNLANSRADGAIEDSRRRGERLRELTADLEQEQELHRQDVAELKGERDDAVACADSRGERRRKLREAVEGAGMLLAPEAGRNQNEQEVAVVLDRAILVDDELKAVDSGRRMLEAVARGEDRPEIPRCRLSPVPPPAPIGGEAAGIFVGRPTDDGYGFERLDLPLQVDDVVAFVRGGTAKIAERIAKAEEAKVAAEERAEELQAWADDVRPGIEVLLEELAGEEPAWWIKAGRALDRDLRRLSSSILLAPPGRGNGDEIPVDGAAVQALEEAGDMGRSDGLR